MKYKTKNEKVKVQLQNENNELIIELIEVKKEYRNKGLAQSELDNIIKFANNNKEILNIDKISLYCETQEIEMDNDRLADFYLYNGFKRVEGSDIMEFNL